MEKFISWIFLIIFFTTNVLMPVPLFSVHAQQIVVDQHNTSELEIIDKVTNVRTNNEFIFDDGNALNSFEDFNVYQDNIVNLYLSNGTENLINLVHNSTTNIDGTLNSIKDNDIGGSIYFLNPHGIMVGKTGVVNVGSLTAVTPTQDFMDDIFTSPGNISQEKIIDITGGVIPVSKTGLISVRGEINAVNDINLKAAEVVVDGSDGGQGILITDADYSEENENNTDKDDFSNAVNVNGIKEGEEVVVENGEIIITAGSEKGTEAAVEIKDAEITAENIDINTVSTLNEKDSSEVINKNISSEITVDSSKIEASDSINIKSYSNTDLEFGSSVLDSADSTDAALAVSNLESKSQVSVGGSEDNETVLKAAGEINITADNKVNLKAAADASGSNKIGGALAVNTLVTETSAVLEDGVQIKGNPDKVNVQANSKNEVNSTALASREGVNIDENYEQSNTKEQLQNYSDQISVSTSTGDASRIDAAAAFVVNEIDSKTEAAIKGNDQLESDADFTVESNSINNIFGAADGSSTRGEENSIGAAAALNLVKSRNTALVERDLAVNSLEINAGTADYFDNNGDNSSNNYELNTLIGSSGENISGTGGLSLNIIDQQYSSLLNSDLDLSGNLNLRAFNNTKQKAETIPADDPDSNNKIGIGAAASVNIYKNNLTEALINENGAVNSAENVDIYAEGINITDTFAEVGIYGDLAVVPVSSISLIKNQVEAGIAESSLENSNLDNISNLTISSENTNKVDTTAVGSTHSSNIGLGASMSLNVIEASSKAYLNRDVDNAGDITVNSQNYTHALAESKAGSKGEVDSDSEDSSASLEDKIASQLEFYQQKQGEDSEAAVSTSTKEGKLDAAAAVSVNIVESSSEAEVAKPLDSEEKMQLNASNLEINAAGQTDSILKADGSTVNDQVMVGLAAAAAVNKVNSTKSSYLGTGNYNIDSLTMGSKDALNPFSVEADLYSDFTAEAISGAGSQKVGLAGALALNMIEENYSLIKIEADSDINLNENSNNADLILNAENRSNSTAIALPSGAGGSGNLGVGASAAINELNEGVELSISNNTDFNTLLDKIELSAYSDFNTHTEAEAGAAGGVAVDTSLAFADLNHENKIYFGRGNILNSNSDFIVQNISSGTNFAEARGIAEGDDVGLGASGAVILSNTKSSDGKMLENEQYLNSVLINRDLNIGGEIGLKADSNRSYEALAYGSSMGADSLVSDSLSQQVLSENKDNQQVEESVEMNSSAEEETSSQLPADGAKVEVAASLGLLYLNDDVRAAIIGGSSKEDQRQIQAGEDINVEVINQSNYRTKADSYSVGQGITSIPDNSIGAAAALNITRSSSEAYIGDYSTIKNADNININAKYFQNNDQNFVDKISAESISGTGSTKISGSASMALINSKNSTTAHLGSSEFNDTGINDLNVNSYDLSRMSTAALSGAAGGKVGVGGSTAVILTDNKNHAYLASDSKIYVDNLNIKAESKKVDSDIMEMSNFNSLELMSLIGEKNYYAQAAAGSAGGKAAVSGSLVYNKISDSTKAYTGDNTEIRAFKNINLSAENSKTAAAATGSVGLAGSVGAGLAGANIIYENETKSYIGENNKIISYKDIKVMAQNNLDLDLYGISAAAAGTFGLSGVFNYVNSQNNVEAYIGRSSRTTAAQNIDLGVENEFSLLNLNGGAAAGGTVGIGVSAAVNKINNKSSAYLAEGVEINEEYLKDILIIEPSELADSEIYILAEAVEIAGEESSLTRYHLLSSADIEKLQQSELAELKVYKLSEISEDYTSADDLYKLAADLSKIENKNIYEIENDEVLTENIIDEENEIELFAGDSLSAEDKQKLIDAGYESVEITAVIYSSGEMLSLDNLENLKSNLNNNQELRLTALVIEDNDLQSEQKTDSLNIKAQGSSKINSLSAGIGAAGTFSLAGSSVITDLNSETTAYVDSNNDNKSIINLSNKLAIESEEINTINTKAGALSFSGTAAVGGSYNQLDLNSKVNSYLGESAEIEINRYRNNLTELNLKSDLINQVDAETLGGAAAVGGGSVGATYLNISDQSRVSTYLADDGLYNNIHLLNLDSYYKLKSKNTDQLRARAIGAAAGLYIGAGAAKSDVKIDSHTASYFGDNLIIQQEENPYLSGSQVKVNAFSDYGVDNYAFAGAMGAGSLNGAHALSVLNAETKAYTGSNFYLDLGRDYYRNNNFEVISKNRNNVKSKAEGLNIGGISVGVSYSQSKINNKIESYLAENNDINVAGDVTIQSANLMPQNSSNYTASAESNSAVGTLVGGNGSIAEVKNYSEIYAGAAENSSIDLMGDFSVNSFNRSSLNAEASGVTAGLAAAGYTKAKIESTVQTKSEIAENTVLKNADKFNLKADSDDIFNIDVISGSGGGITGNAAAAEIVNDALTESVYLGEAENGFTIGDVNIYSNYNLRFNSTADSLNASVLGGSGAKAANNINSNVKIEIGSSDISAALYSDNLYLNAQNDINKIRPAAGKYNAQASSGGVVTGAAANSESRFNIGTKVNIFDNAELRTREDISIDTENLYSLFDRSKLDASGAISIAGSKSLLNVENSESIINIGDAELTSGGRIDIGAFSQAYLSSSANTKTYGLASSGEGESYTAFNNNNKVLINSGALLYSGKYLDISAGANTSGKINNFNLYADTDVYNKTINPVDKNKVKADSHLNENNIIKIDSGSTLKAVNDINLKSAESKRSVSASGRGKDLYRKILEEVSNFFRKLVGADEISIEIKTGSAGSSTNRRVEVDGSLTAGIHNKMNLLVGTNGDIENISDGLSYNERKEDVVSNMIDRITELRELQAVYNNDEDAYTAYEIEINFLLNSLKRRGLVEIDEDGNIYPLRSIEVSKIALDDLYASGGDINIESAVLQGSGSLTANSDPEINIKNNSAKFLELNKAVIGEIGGRVRVNNKQTEQHSNLNIENNYDPDNYYPQIIVHNTFKPMSETEIGTDINIQDTILNEMGEIKITSDEGSIHIYGKDSDDTPDLTAETVNLKAGQDIVQSYKEGFVHVGGDPRSLWRDKQDEMGLDEDIISGNHDEYRPAKGSRIAGNNIFLSATYLNLNGLIQSGLPYWNLELSDLETEIEKYINDWEDADKPDLKNFNDLQNYQLSAFDNEERRDDQEIAAYFNPQTEQIELNNAVVKGGYIEIFGEISNTGGGEIKAVDGYGRINISNNTPYDMVINNLDTGNDIDSLIRITDTANTVNIDEQITDVPITTEYRRNGNMISINESISYNNNGQQISQNLGTNYLDGRNTSYTPAEGLRYNWTLGKDYTERFVGVGFAEGYFADGDAKFEDADYYNESWYQISEGKLASLKDGVYTSIGEDIDGDGESQIYEYNFSNYETSDKELVSRQRWWRLWGGRYWVRDIWEQGSQDIHTHSIKADYQIPIEFIGEDSGELNIMSDGGGDVILNGSLNNGNGSIDINADASLKQNNDNARLTADYFNLKADGGIGEDHFSLMLDARDNGLINAQSLNGSIFIEDTVSNMNIENINAADKVRLKAADDIYSSLNTDTAKIRGAEIELISESGSIGSSDKYMLIDSTEDKGLTVLALNDINISEVEGDLPLNSIKSLAGDINLEVKNGDLKDANTNEIKDERTIEELNRHWDEMLLRGEAAEESKNNALNEYSSTKEAEYHEYWELRGLKTEKYDDNGNIVYTVGEYDEENADAELRELHEVYGSQEYKNNWSFLDDFSEEEKDRAVADMSWTEKRSQLLDGYKWTEDELQNSFSRELLMKETTDTVTEIEEANLEAENISLYVHNGSIGTNNGEIIIDLDNITDYEKAKLLAAEEKDIVLDEENGKIIVIDRESVDIELPEDGSITAEAVDHVYLGSEKDIYIDSIIGGKEIRVKGKNGVYSTASEGEVNIEGSSTILEGGDGGLGTADKELILKLKEDSDLTARTFEDINIYQKDGDLNLAFIYSENGDINLTADGYLNDRRGEIRDYTINANGLNLESKNASIGSQNWPLYINLNEGSVSSFKAAESISVKEYDGDIILNTAEAGDKIIINAENSIYAEDAAKGKIAGDKIELEAENGSIGSQDARIKTYSGTELNARANNDIYLSEYKGDLNSKYLLSNNIIDLLILNGNLNAENIRSSKFKAQLLQSGASAVIEELELEKELKLWADNVDIKKLIHESDIPLNIFIRGGRGKMMDNLKLNVQSNSPLIFNNLSADFTEINAAADQLEFYDFQVGSLADINSNYYRVMADNINKVLHDSHLQLYPEKVPFDLFIDTMREFITDTYVVNYNDDFIINKFNSENSFIRRNSNLNSTIQNESGGYDFYAAGKGGILSLNNLINIDSLLELNDFNEYYLSDSLEIYQAGDIESEEENLGDSGGDLDD
ncbi:MAG: leukotoxin LktA family filamentous adhesin [Halanaerobium sp.]